VRAQTLTKFDRNPSTTLSDTLKAKKINEHMEIAHRFILFFSWRRNSSAI